MPLNAARDQPHGSITWTSLSSPTKRNTGSKSIHPHRRNASSTDDSNDGYDGSQDLPRYVGDKMTKDASIWKSLSKHARRRPRLAILVVIGLILLLAVPWNQTFSQEDAVAVITSQDIVSSPSNARKPMLDLNPRPVVRNPSGRKDEKYMAYFPHSVSPSCSYAEELVTDTSTCRATTTNAYRWRMP